MVGVVTELLVPLGDNRSADYSSLTTEYIATPYLVIALSSQSVSRKEVCPWRREVQTPDVTYSSPILHPGIVIYVARLVRGYHLSSDKQKDI